MTIATLAAALALGAIVPGEYWVSPDGKPDAEYTRESPGSLAGLDAVHGKRAQATGKPDPRQVKTVLAKGTYRLADILTNLDPKREAAFQCWSTEGTTNILAGATGDATDVVLDGTDFPRRALWINGISRHRIEGITFRNFATKGNGGAVIVGNHFAGGDFHARIDNCVFQRNSATGDGGAVWGCVEVRDSRFAQNTSLTGRGGAFYGSPAENGLRALAERCTFVDNLAPEFDESRGVPAFTHTTLAGWIRTKDNTVESWQRDVFGKTQGPFTERVVLKPDDDLVAARDLLRRERSRKGRAEIVLKDGWYVFTNALALTGRDSRLTIRAEHPGKAFVTAGPIFRGSQFLKSGGLLELPVSDDCHAFLTNAVRPVLSVDGVAMTHARWPNVGGWVVPKDAVSEKDRAHVKMTDARVARWTFDGAKVEAFGMTGQYSAGGFVVNGYDAASQTLAVKGSVWPGMRLFFHGVKEEIDQPGEWAYDAKARKILLMPTAAFSPESRVALGVHAKGLFDITGDGVRIEGLRFTAVPGGKDAPIRLTCGTGGAIVGCSFTAFGGNAIFLGGMSNVVQSCDFADLYGTGVTLRGGDKRTLRPGCNAVDNCFFDRPAVMRDGFSKGAVEMDGVENRISHCLIRNTREHAIDWNGYGCVIEYCRIYDANLEYRDAGVVYSNGAMVNYGNRFRFNDVSGSPGLSHGVYPDDLSSGYHIYGNVIRNIGWGGVFLGGGRDNVISNNVFTSIGAMALHNDNRGLFWDAWKNREHWHEMMVRDYDYMDGPVGKRFPKLTTWYADGTNMFGNVDNEWVNNVIIDSPAQQDQVCLGIFIPKERQTSRGNVTFGLRGEPSRDFWRFGGFKAVDTRATKAPLFKDVPPRKTVNRADGLELFAYEKGDFNLAEGSVVPAEVSGFQPIPWDKIGLYRDAWRKTLPEETGAYGETAAPTADANAQRGASVRLDVRLSGNADATVEVKTAGLYHVWAMAKAGKASVVTVAGTEFKVNPEGAAGKSVWTRAGQVMLPAGQTAVSVRAEDRGALTQATLATDPDWCPPGVRKER